MKIPLGSELWGTDFQKALEKTCIDVQKIKHPKNFKSIKADFYIQNPIYC